MNRKMRKVVRRLERRHREDLTEATAYMVARIKEAEEAAADLRGDNVSLRDNLMVATLRLAVTHGYLAGAAGAAGVPAMAVEDVCPGQAWWH